jgi:hypothetical protein
VYLHELLFNNKIKQIEQILFNKTVTSVPSVVYKKTHDTWINDYEARDLAIVIYKKTGAKQMPRACTNYIDL